MSSLMDLVAGDARDIVLALSIDDTQAFEDRDRFVAHLPLGRRPGPHLARPVQRGGALGHGQRRARRLPRRPQRPRWHGRERADRRPRRPRVGRAGGRRPGRAARRRSRGAGSSCSRRSWGSCRARRSPGSVTSRAGSWRSAARCGPGRRRATVVCRSARPSGSVAERGPGRSARLPRSAPRAPRGTHRGWMNATGPSAPFRGTVSISSRPSNSRRVRDSARFSTSKQTWWNPSPFDARNLATPVVSSVGTTSSTLDSPTGRNAIVTPSASIGRTSSTGSPSVSRQNPSASSRSRTTSATWWTFPSRADVRGQAPHGTVVRHRSPPPPQTVISSRWTPQAARSRSEISPTVA